MEEEQVALERDSTQFLVTAIFIRKNTLIKDVGSNFVLIFSIVHKNMCTRKYIIIIHNATNKCNKL